MSIYSEYNEAFGSQYLEFFYDTELYDDELMYLTEEDLELLECDEVKEDDIPF